MTPESRKAMEKAIDILRRVPCTLDEPCQTCAAVEQIRIAMKDPEPEEKAALELRIENLSVLLRNCFRWAKNRHPEVACEKIAILSDKCQHLLTPVSVFRSAPPAQESPEVRELVDLLRDSLRSRKFPAPEDSEVRELGRRIGFGALMGSAQKAWREYLESEGLPGGEFTVGHCVTTVRKALDAYDAKKGQK